MKTEFVTDWRHWLFGVNWSHPKVFSVTCYVAIHFGPWCLLLKSEKEKQPTKRKNKI